jgi:hypothetical protein
MGVLNFDPITLTTLILLTAAIYFVIILVFMNARRKYKGGIVEKVITLIIGSIGLFLVSDIALFLIPIYSFKLGYTIHVVLKICAMSLLSVGGLEFFIR